MSLILPMQQLYHFCYAYFQQLSIELHLCISYYRANVITIINSTATAMTTSNVTIISPNTITITDTATTANSITLTTATSNVRQSVHSYRHTGSTIIVRSTATSATISNATTISAATITILMPLTLMFLLLQ